MKKWCKHGDICTSTYHKPQKFCCVKEARRQGCIFVARKLSPGRNEPSETLVEQVRDWNNAIDCVGNDAVITEFLKLMPALASLPSYRCVTRRQTWWKAPAVFWATSSGNNFALGALIGAGADVNKAKRVRVRKEDCDEVCYYGDHDTAVHAVSSKSSLNILIDNGADINVTNLVVPHTCHIYIKKYRNLIGQVSTAESKSRLPRGAFIYPMGDTPGKTFVSIRSNHFCIFQHDNTKKKRNKLCE